MVIGAPAALDLVRPAYSAQEFLLCSVVHLFWGARLASQAAANGNPEAALLEPITDEKMFDKRLAALEAVFGTSDDLVLHAVIPFEFGSEVGGAADVVQFSNHVVGTLYVTCELLGRPEQVANAFGTYELAICDRSDRTWPAELISKLAYYTLEARLEPGHTMDIASLVPKPCPITALLFDDFASFSFAGEPAGVLLCMGITADELSACRRGRRDRVVKALKSKGVYPFTDLKRRSSLSLF